MRVKAPIEMGPEGEDVFSDTRAGFLGMDQARNRVYLLCGIQDTFPGGITAWLAAVFSTTSKKFIIRRQPIEMGPEGEDVFSDTRAGFLGMDQARK